MWPCHRYRLHTCTCMCPKCAATQNIYCTVAEWHKWTKPVVESCRLVGQTLVLIWYRYRSQAPPKHAMRLLIWLIVMVSLLYSTWFTKRQSEINKHILYIRLLTLYTNGIYDVLLFYCWMLYCGNHSSKTRSASVQIVHESCTPHYNAFARMR